MPCFCSFSVAVISQKATSKASTDALIKVGGQEVTESQYHPFLLESI